MADQIAAPFEDRGVVAIGGADAAKLLQGLITNTVPALPGGQPVFAGLLSPQGKILFDFFLVPTGDGFLIDVARDRAAALAQRFTLYRLRADVNIKDASGDYQVWVGDGATPDGAFIDPRDGRMGWRAIVATSATDHATAADRAGQASTPDKYHARRVALGIPEGGRDYAFGDAFPHEANFDLINGASFSKGCFVGQEIVARMQNKSVVRKRVVAISADRELESGSDVRLGDVAIGSIGTVDGVRALALLRIDRVAEAIDTGRALTAGGVTITVDPIAVARYRTAAAAKPSAAGLPS